MSRRRVEMPLPGAPDNGAHAALGGAAADPTSERFDAKGSAMATG